MELEELKNLFEKKWKCCTYDENVIGKISNIISPSVDNIDDKKSQIIKIDQDTIEHDELIELIKTLIIIENCASKNTIFHVEVNGIKKGCVEIIISATALFFQIASFVFDIYKYRKEKKNKIDVDTSNITKPNIDTKYKYKGNDCQCNVYITLNDEKIIKKISKTKTKSI